MCKLHDWKETVESKGIDNNLPSMIMLSEHKQISWELAQAFSMLFVEVSVGFIINHIFILDFLLYVWVIKFFIAKLNVSVTFKRG